MGFQIFLGVCLVLIPLVMMVFGGISKNHPPKNINGWYGYRTERSMKSQAAWDFAQRRFAGTFLKGGAILLVPSLAAAVLSCFLDEGPQGILCLVIITVQTVALVLCIPPVEKALNANFDNEGRPKEERGQCEKDSE